jgi:hypothetical protein
VSRNDTVAEEDQSGFSPFRRQRLMDPSRDDAIGNAPPVPSGFGTLPFKQINTSEQCTQLAKDMTTARGGLAGDDSGAVCTVKSWIGAS